MNPVEQNCPVCTSLTIEAMYDLTGLSSSDAVPGIVARCAGCSMWFKLLKDPNGIPKAYTGEYGDDPTAATYLLGDEARALFRNSLAKIKTHLPSPTPHLLDLGAGQGALLEEAVKLGFEAEGIDHCEANVHDARSKGLRVRLAAAEDLDDRGVFDAITMMDIIEHVPDPMRILNAAQRALKPGGQLVVYTPNHRAAVVVLARLLFRLGIRYPVDEIFGRNHVSFFDDHSLPNALRTAGFQVDLLERFPYDPARPGQEVSPLNLAAVILVEWLGWPFGRVFRMLTYASKPL